MSTCSYELGPYLGTQQGTLATGSAGTTRRQVRERDHVSVSVVTGCHLLASPPSYAGAHVGAKVCRAISDARAARSHDTGASASGHSKEAGGRAPASRNSVTGYAAPSCASPASRSARSRSRRFREPWRRFSSAWPVRAEPFPAEFALALTASSGLASLSAASLAFRSALHCRVRSRMHFLQDRKPFLSM